MVFSATRNGPTCMAIVNWWGLPDAVATRPHMLSNTEKTTKSATQKRMIQDTGSGQNVAAATPPKPPKLKTMTAPVSSCPLRQVAYTQLEPVSRTSRKRGHWNSRREDSKTSSSSAAGHTRIIQKPCSLRKSRAALADGARRRPRCCISRSFVASNS